MAQGTENLWLADLLTRKFEIVECERDTESPITYHIHKYDRYGVVGVTLFKSVEEAHEAIEDQFVTFNKGLNEFMNWTRDVHNRNKTPEHYLWDWPEIETKAHE